MNAGFRYSVIVLTVSVFSASLLSIPSLITSLEIKKNQVFVQINEQLKQKYLTNDFFARYDSDIDLTKMDPSIALMPFLLNIVTVVWISGQDYAIDFMDKDVFYALRTIKQVFKKQYPHTNWEGEIIPKKLIKNKPEHLKDPASQIALLFSGGLDSVCSSLYHGAKKQLLITAWGQFDVPLRDPGLWKARKKEFLAFAKKYGHTNSFVQSNYGDFLNWEVLSSISREIYDWRVDANEGIGMMGLAAPILYAKGYPILYIASSYTWNFPYPTAANPLVDDNIRFASGIRANHDHFELSRLDKLAFVARGAREKRFEIPRIKVCAARTTKNCCFDCCKCTTTALGLLALDENLKSYGFSVAPEKIVEKIKERLNTPLHYWELWNFLEIQLLLKERKKKGENLSPLVSWLLKVDLSKHIAYAHIKYKKPADWEEYEELAPAHLTIPHVQKLRLNYKNSIEDK